MSTAAGEYVSVSSQADTENADLERERRELTIEPDLEMDELTAIYLGRNADLVRALERLVKEAKGGGRSNPC